MNINKNLRSSFAVIAFITSLAALGAAQDKSCDLRLNVFFQHERSDYPQDTPVKNARATVVDLNSNETFKSKTVGEMPYFAALPEGRYNIVVSKDGYNLTAKEIGLDCRFRDEKNVAEEIIFLVKDGGATARRMWQVDFEVVGEGLSPSAPPPPGSKSDYVPPLMVSSVNAAMTERAVYFPPPVFSAEAQKFRDDYAASARVFIVMVRLTVDETGKVTDAKIEDGFKELNPAILEAARKIKFTPLKVRGKPAKVFGFVNYVFRK